MEKLPLHPEYVKALPVDKANNKKVKLFKIHFIFVGHFLLDVLINIQFCHYFRVRVEWF